MSDILTVLMSLDKKVDKMAEHLSDLPCSVHATKIKFLERIVYGAVAIILLGWMISIGNGNKSASAVCDLPLHTLQESHDSNQNNTSSLLD